jgi:hypothetical protein
MRPLKLLPLFVLASALAGCDMHDGCDHDDDGYGDPGGGPTPVQVQQESISADAKLAANPGEGVGVFIEYATGGHWNLYTTCDYGTATNPGYACGFEVFAAVVSQGGAISNVAGNDLEGADDSISLEYDGSVHLYAENKLGLAGMSFDAPAGAAVEFEVYVDGEADPHFIYWVGDFQGQQVLHNGAPTDPIDLVPNEVVAPADGAGMGSPGK